MGEAVTGSLRRPEHPGSGRRQARALPKGRQAGLEAREAVEALLGDSPRHRDLLIEYLHRIQDRHGQIPADLLAALAEALQLSYAEVYEVATFYAHFDVVKEGMPPLPPLTVRVCDSLTCAMHGAAALHEALDGRVGPGARVVRAPCLGLCDQAPVVEVGHHFLHHARPEAVLEAIHQGDIHPHMADYVDLDRYRAAGGYRLLERLRAGGLEAEAVIAALEHGGLRGLGGAGFPTGRKWRAVREQPGPRLMAVNGDEGEPGTFKDRHYLNTDPHRFLEGTLIAAHVVEADEVFIYLRDEYPLAREILAREIAKLPPGGPALHMRRGAGAYICGEESALLESLEGKRGLPRHKPPFPFQRGLFGRPTLINNVETLYWVRDILERGPDWWAGQGRHGGKGLRSFSVSGRVREPGVKLAPAGITLSELVEEYCGGMAEGHELLAFLPGGASGGILPASLADLPLDFGTLEPHGCFIGSAAVIVLSQADDLRAAALNVMRFFEDESCGQCTPCRIGTQKARMLMEREEWDTALLQELSEVMREASICGLGQAASNPLLSLLRHFPEIAGKEGHPA
ncbi:NAD(P)H-dependent oxidoreductase subunit E (plasmid) [Roseomonas marmotae]|uniref:NAD(P)H-dependent oxidoreductase subunit E n=1 Tax=Roseomonas marmotae TaxID=2768161 RepID=A0ABS3KDL6_9PROT|nr:NAD(P)H-dependent oxidoreductase subunit E [Roseomonas marmotae]MBO1075559.1 NAD(P)H-dependent oxidoreductase subunit E [Roseomonas marmotae]QTI81547.1 NAD(P)H-dependent oxidoreductase subunit E [Roseomonas marmotae]